ncbi:phosducin-like protein [Actinia tenebrosa]|uniref:Phosducin-like protein n=1 Tax=Actinia tenebrosa TaxID=6105 RepID=A0A6P8HVZ8_ACTTE|nr:phosducin-like protein [Actinia tenebrosa]
MASLDDKLLGYKTQNYVSSSESEEESEEGEAQPAPATSKEPSKDFRLASETKTGPKGVLQDFQRYKQLETEQRHQQEEELKALVNKFSISCQSSLDDEKEKALMKELEIEEDEFLKQYHFKRLLQMKEEQDRKISETRPKFGQVVEIATSDSFLHVIDKELLHVVIVVHLYDEDLPSCLCMNECLDCLALQYPMVKFCRVKAVITGISANFRENGLPALLVYKGEQMIGNFVQLEGVFGDHFHSADVESFLIENGILSEEPVANPLKLVEKTSPSNEESDSDLELD